ncbi:hypothetical protein [Bradyrhizobium sp. Cp5.3]|uniref:hypothetical protein n=1 Tax=Bradyrhizobium sp. Cp5.3 TaxID=443598 RepID=UPI000487C791|nr:hypothetical protein [Bradyrhizobium sp. Cp5.3]
MSIVRRIRFPRPRTPAEPLTAVAYPMEPIVWHEAGGWSVGWSDDAPAFEARNLAVDTWRRRTHARPP